MSTRSLIRAVFLATTLVLIQGTWALAGTTGGLSGIVLLNTGVAVSAVTVTATSPSQTISTTTDPTGHFSLISLIPDTYSVSAAKSGYETVTQNGITVTADHTQTLTLLTSRRIRTLGQVTTRAATELVRPGTTADVYSVTQTTQEKSATMGGGGSLDQAYSAIAAVPGVVVPPGQAGWFQTVYIRGGDFDQIGYEYDGVPVLRSYDNYPATNASSIGQEELQVYTGAAPANAESSGLAGYINQVIRTGTYPGFGTLKLSMGSPIFHNAVNLEVGGATPNRNFSYFVGIGVSDSNSRALDQSNGTSINQLFGTPLAPAASPNNCADPNSPATSSYVGCYANAANPATASAAGPGGYILGGYQIGGTAHISQRENIVNLHFGIPHKNDAGKDDIQFLANVEQLYNHYYSSALDWGLPLLASAGICNTSITGACVGSFNYTNSYVYQGPVGAPLPANASSLVSPYYFPQNPEAAGTPVGCAAIGSTPNCVPGGYPIPLNRRDVAANGQTIEKLQYQKNFSSNAFLRIYGFSFYSDWPQNGPFTLASNYIGIVPIDYYVRTLAHGVSATFSDQLNPKHLLTLQGSYTNLYDYRMNSSTTYTSSSRTRIAYLVDSSNPQNGICYNAALTPVSCYSSAAQSATIKQVRLGTVPPAAGTCGAGPCQWFVVENNYRGGANNERPRFSSASITDQFKPSDRVVLNLGVRFDSFVFHESNTDQAPGAGIVGSARPFWFNATNNSYCVAPGPGNAPVQNKWVGTPVCPAGSVPATLTDLPSFVQTYNVWQPRVGATYTLNPDNVLRFSYGRYDQPANSAFQQYNLLQQNLPRYDLENFYAFGFNTTSHNVPPQISYNTDLSLEHHFPGSDASFKLTPYLRKTVGQVQNFYLDQKTNFVSGLNDANQTTSGLEFQLNKGDFNKAGWSGQFSYTLTNAWVKFLRLGNGGTVISPINISIKGYNQYTAFCATNFSDPRCGGLSAAPATAFPCYTAAGTGAPCAPGLVANPYYNAPAQPLFDEGASYRPFSTIPGAFNSSTNSYITPANASLILNYKRDKIAITPAFQFFAGNHYGAPLQSPGVDPTTCKSLAGSNPASDPRYPFGAPGGSGYDATSCTGSVSIPDPYTGKFDNLGEFKAPNHFLMHMQITYDATPRVRLNMSLLNIVNSCFGGDERPWSQGLPQKNKVCGYGLPGYAPLPSVGNFYNPGAAFQRIVQYPYMPLYTGGGPFNADFGVQIKL